MRVFIVLLMFCFGILDVVPAEARQERIAVVVNDDAVSMSDVNDRLKLILSSSGLPNTQEIRDKLVRQVIGSLVEEQIKIQEARRLKIETSQEEINRGFATIAQQNKLSAEQFSDMLSKGGINIVTMLHQIEAQIAWTKIVQQELRPKINVTDNDIQNVFERFENNKGMMEYRVAEIFLPVDDPKNEANTRQLAQRLTSQVKSGQAPFFKLAQQFSKAAGSVKGGEMGWVQHTQLSDEVSGALKTLKKGEISAPIRSLNGYHIMLLHDQRRISEETFPSRDQISATLGLERLERLQRRYYLDLKATAFIENRLGS